jgi:Spy/CpxP family protein refolding chaperone
MNAKELHRVGRQLVLLVLAAVLAGGVAAAQTRTPRAAPPAPRAQAKAKAVAAGLELTAQQRRELRKIVLDGAIQNTETRAALQKAHLELARLLGEDRPDAAALDRKATEIGELQGKLLRARVEGALKMRAVLTPEQRDKLGPGAFMGRGMGLGAGRGFGRRGMGMGRGGWLREGPGLGPGSGMGPGLEIRRRIRVQQGWDVPDVPEEGEPS